MAEPKRIRLSEQTSDRLYEMIVEECRYAPGSKLPNENELSEELQVSRTTLREAISFLVAQGVLEIQRGRGTFVAEDLPTAGMDLTSLTGIRSRGRARDLFEMRLIFEPATVALACQRATDEELRMIQKKAEWVEEVARQGGDWAKADQELHWAIIRASHNEYMRRLYPIINSAVDEIMQISSNRKYMEEIALTDNRLILEFLLKRDEEGASHAMSIHMKHLIHSMQNEA
jgi:DNA-binding FadR family transcriptional regulator